MKISEKETFISFESESEPLQSAVFIRSNLLINFSVSCYKRNEGEVHLNYIFCIAFLVELVEITMF